jgi:hypothetical protein
MNSTNPLPQPLLAAIERNFAEANNAILKLTAYNELCRQDITYARMSFFVIVEQALHYDMIAHAMKILDSHTSARGLAYIKKVNRAAVLRAATKCKIDLDEIETLASKLKHVRDKTQFHIDAESLKDAKAIWRSADIRGDLFVRSLRNLAVLLSVLKADLFGGEVLEVTEYDGSDIPKIVKAFETIHGITHGA